MARMIPTQISKDTKSMAEREIFVKISTDLSDEWIALHSLGVLGRGRVFWTEVDFVLIGPKGVYCLEVKGGTLRRERGQWYQKDKDGIKERQLKKGPFDQVKPPTFSLFNYLKRPDSKLTRETRDRVIVEPGVVTPDMVFNVPGPDIIEEMIYDRRDQDSSFENYVEKLSSYWIDQHNRSQELTFYERKACLDELRADFDPREALPDMRARVRREIISLTNEQYDLLDRFNLGQNPRLLIDGGAGSGKTMCAVDMATVQATNGKKVLLLCYNERLATYLKSLAETSIPVDIFYIHDLMNSAISRAGLEDSLGPEPLWGDEKEHYYNVKYPEVCGAALLELDELESYDIVIVDEGQDLIKEGFLEVIHLLLKGGIMDGSWAIFYDEKQNIFGGLTESAMDRLDEARPSKFTLTANCRNTLNIAKAVEVLSGLTPALSTTLDGPKLKIIWYKDKADQKQKISRVISNWVSGLSEKEREKQLSRIAVISPYSQGRSCLAKGLEPPLNLQDWDRDKLPPKGIIPFSTIQAFKGLESDMVVIADIDNPGNPGFASIYPKLLYTGASRAKSELILAISETLRDRYSALVPLSGDL